MQSGYRLQLRCRLCRYSKNKYRGANSGQEWKCCGSAEGWPQLYQYKELSKDAANQQSMQQTTLARLCMRTEEVEGS
jgi:hypothetical protein